MSGSSSASGSRPDPSGSSSASGSRPDPSGSSPPPALEGPAGLPRNYLRPCLLLLLAEGSAHGYDLLEQLPDLGHHRADPGGMYRSLRAMEQEGLVTSQWQESPAGPARRTYELTDEGRDWLHAWAGSLRLVHASLDTFLSRYVVAAEEPARRSAPR